MSSIPAPLALDTGVGRAATGPRSVQSPRRVAFGSGAPASSPSLSLSSSSSSSDRPGVPGPDSSESDESSSELPSSSSDSSSDPSPACPIAMPPSPIASSHPSNARHAISAAPASAFNALLAYLAPGCSSPTGSTVLSTAATRRWNASNVSSGATGVGSPVPASTPRFLIRTHDISRSCQASSICSLSVSALRSSLRAYLAERLGSFEPASGSSKPATRAAVSHHGSLGAHSAVSARTFAAAASDASLLGSNVVFSSADRPASPSPTPSDAPASASALAAALAASRKDSCVRMACLLNSYIGLPSSQCPTQTSACQPSASARHRAVQKTSAHPPLARLHGTKAPSSSPDRRGSVGLSYLILPQPCGLLTAATRSRRVVAPHASAR
mmetsp:Transcript_11182/g.45027  ORF Transcript_11182/g.45027 Transcript_11182/m.45027 type:complete len:385 (+) Transcript_11182:1741-2895(+)